MGAFCCHGNQSFDLICPKTLCSLSPTQVMLHIKFDLGLPAGFRDIQVWKCGRRTMRTDDDGRTDGRPLLYYKLTLWAFGSGELKTHLFKFEPPHDKTNKMTVPPVKTQISLGIHPVWSQSSLCAQWVAKDPSFLHTDSEDWSDWADAQADPIFAGGTYHIVGLVMRRLISWKLQPIFQVALLFGLLQ